MSLVIEKLKFDKDGLIPAIIQDVDTLEVLMMAYMNRESLTKTLATGKTWFWSRSRRELWNKGATSGHYQHVRGIFYDCDADTLLVKVVQEGAACHEGDKSCFHYPLEGSALAGEGPGGTSGEEVVTQILEKQASPAGGQAGEDAPDRGSARVGGTAEILAELYQVILDRKAKGPEGSYTTYLFNKGLDKILKKVGEETAEVIIAAKNGSREEVIYEAADLTYHLLVLLAQQEIRPEDIYGELAKRR